MLASVTHSIPPSIEIYLMGWCLSTQTEEVNFMYFFSYFLPTYILKKTTFQTEQGE